MKEMGIMDVFTKEGAYHRGHFKLSSGLHSGAYLQCALVLQNPPVAARLCEELAEKFREEKPDIIIGPAMGGIVLAYELARAMNAKALFSERDKEGRMALRRGFEVGPENRVLIAEDVLTTGKSVREVIAMLKDSGIEPVGIASLVNRSGGDLDFSGIKYESLLKLDVTSFKESDCPLCREGVPIVKPGYRKE